MIQPKCEHYRIIINDYNWSFTLIREYEGNWVPVIYFSDINVLADFTRSVGENLKDMAGMADVLAQAIKAYQKIVTPSGTIVDYVNTIAKLDEV